MYLKKYLVSLLISSFYSLSLGQTVYLDSLGYKNPHIVCKEDTLELFFGSDYFIYADLNIDLPAGYEFGSVVSYGPCFCWNSPPITSNPNNIIIPSSAPTTPYSMNSIRFTVIPSCGSNPENFKFWFTESGFSVSDTLQPPIINVQQPYLIFQGIENTKVANSTINLNRLAVTQKYRRCFKVDYSSLISSIDQIVVQVPNSRLNFNYFWVSPGVSSTTISDTVYYTFNAAFFSTIGDGDGLFEPGESFTFCDSVEVRGNCNSQNSNVGLNYGLTWGCGGKQCQYAIAPVEGKIALSPIQTDITRRADLEILPSLCDTCGKGLVKYAFQLINNTQPVLPTGGFLTNLRIDLGVIPQPHTVASSRALTSQNHCFDSVKINGTKVSFINSPTIAPMVIQNLTIPGTGLLDIDNDGFYDDLPAGDTLVIEYFGSFYPTNHDTSDITRNTSGGNINVGPSLIQSMRSAIDIEYKDECGGNAIADKRTLGVEMYLDPTTSTSQMQPDVYNGGIYRYTIKFSGSNNKSTYKCDSAVQEIIFSLPADISLDTTSTNLKPISNFDKLSTDSVFYYIEVDGPDDKDTLKIYFLGKGPHATPEKEFYVDLRMDCDFTAGFCPEADSLRTIAWNYYYNCYDSLGQKCYTTATHRGIRLIRYHCEDFPPDGVSLKKLGMDRVTMGYTDNTFTTKVSPSSNIDIDKAMVADTVRVTFKGVVVDSILDNIYSRLMYQTAFGKGASQPVFSMDTTNSKVIVYDASSATYYNFKLKLPIYNFPMEWFERNIPGTDFYDWQFNLSSYDDSVRLIDPTYNFEGGPNAVSSSWDSIIMEVLFIVRDVNYGSRFFLEPIGQMIEIPTDTATICDQYGTIFDIDHPSVTYQSSVAGNLVPCRTATNTIEATTASFDHYKNEFRKKEKIDTITYVYNPTYFSAPDSIKLSFSNHNIVGTNLGNSVLNMSFLVSGNTIKIPMEQSSNLSVLPEAYNKATLNIYQIPTCEVQDSMQSSLLGLKSETDITRWDYLSPTIFQTIYDSAFGRGGATGGPIVVSPTPFNINASPVTVSTASDSVCWEISYENLSLTKIDYTWLDFQSDSLNVTSVVRIDSGYNIPLSLISYGSNNGKWVPLDTIKSYDYITTRVCAQYTTCNLDSLIVTGGWNCASLPVNPVQGYSPTDYTCDHNQQSFTVFMDELNAYLQLNILSEPSMPMDLCDSMVFEIEMGNIDLTSLNKLYFSAKLPLSTSNLNVRLGASELKWPNDGVTSYHSISDPVIYGDSLVWDLSSEFKTGILDNFEVPLDSNKAIIKLVFESNCFMLPNDQIRFNAQAERGCNKIVNSVNLASTPVLINGLINPRSRLVRTNLIIDTLNTCDTGNIAHVAFYNILTQPTIGSEVISVQIPPLFDISGNIFNLNHPTYLQSLVPVDTIIGGIRYLEWYVAAGMPNINPFVDSLSFDFVLVETSEIPCSIDTMAFITIEERYSILCVSDSTPCIVVYPLILDSHYFRVEKADLTLSNLITTLDFCSDTLTLLVELSNLGAPVAFGTPTYIYVLADSNHNGIYDSTDVVFDTILFTDSIPTGTIDTISYQFLSTKYSQGEICNLILVMDTSSCICDTSSVIISVQLEMHLDTLTLCEDDSVVFNSCVGTGNYPSRTYTWYDVDGLGNEVYLSSTIILNPTFSPPNISSVTTYRFAVQVVRDSCISEDTIVVIAYPQPNPFDVPNDTICEGDSILLVVTSPQIGITYNIYDTNYNWLDTLPHMFRDTITNKFFIEAVDSLYGCSHIWDTVIINVIPFLTPGIGDSIILCETGGVINLFDSLQGNPDTTGTWRDPLGNPFGVGHHANYDPFLNSGGNYVYTIVNPVCPDTSATIYVVESTGANAGGDSSIVFCQRDPSFDLFLLLTNNPDTTGYWSGLSSLTNGYLGRYNPFNSLPGRYKYKVDKIGCESDSSYIDVIVYPLENPSITIDREQLCLALSDPQINILGDLGGAFSGNNGLIIDPTSGVIDLEATGRGIFEVYYTTPGPCPETDTVEVTITQYGEGCELWIPQFISPNGDGKNDFWVIPGVDEFPNNNMKIFNRWGELVFEANAYNNDWDGKTAFAQIKTNNGSLPSGTYFYVFTPNDINHEPTSGYLHIRY